MSLLYSVLKLVVRKMVKERNHPEETYEDFVRTSHEIQNAKLCSPAGRLCGILV
jgi:hypothetical protein